MLWAFTILSVRVIELKGVCFCCQAGATIQLRSVNITLLFHHVDLFYIRINSILFYMLRYYSINVCVCVFCMTTTQLALMDYCLESNYAIYGNEQDQFETFFKTQVPDQM